MQRFPLVFRKDGGGVEPDGILPPDGSKGAGGGGQIGVWGNAQGLAQQLGGPGGPGGQVTLGQGGGARRGLQQQ